MKRITLITTLALALLIVSANTIAGVVLGGTRVIYWSDKKEATLTLTNTRDDISYLVQSWVSGDEKKTTQTPFIVTPPIFKLGGGKKNILRVVNVDGDLPDDRESLYWINIKPIPGTEQEKDNELQVIIKSTLKLFYRPSSLKDVAATAYKKIEFTKNDSGVDIYNPTPIYINLYSLAFDGVQREGVSMIPPKSHIFIHVDKHVGSITWQAINDNGSLNDTMSYHF